MSHGISRLLNQLRPRTFAIHFTPEYRITYSQYIVNDPQHPLILLEQRRQAERERTGLWWAITTSHKVSKKRVVKSWAKRRVRHAFLAELKARGYNEKGLYLHHASIASVGEGSKGMNWKVAKNAMHEDLKGSLRLMLQPALVTAKYDEVTKEVSDLVDAMIKGASIAGKQIG